METLFRFNKQEAIKAVTALYRGGELSKQEIDMLLNNLLPALPAASRNPWDFVARAVAVGDVRYFLNYINVIDGIAYATDGHRMHYAQVDMESGVYTKGKERMKDDMGKSIDFFEKVMPKCVEWKPVAYSVEVIGDRNIQRVARMSGMAADKGINLAYLLDAVAGDKAATYSTSRKDDYQISVKNKFGRAVIMGTRL